MTNGEKIKQIFPGLQIDEGELEVYMWTTTHDAIDMPLEWWEAEYKEPNHIADASKMIEPTPDDCETCIHNKGVLECDMYGCKYESTTKKCRSCRNFGSHNGICEICKDNKCWTEIEPTTKNDLAVAEMIRLVRESDVIDRTDGSVLAKAFNYLFDKYIEEPTTKNDLGVDCISRQAVLEQAYAYGNGLEPDGYCVNVEDIQALPSVTPQEPQSFKWCTDCKEYDQEKHCCHRYSKVIRNTVAEIKQEPKTGQWIIYNYPGHECVYCSSCKEEYYEEDLYIGGSDFPKYCPNCGCRMVEPQESEDI